MTRELTSRLEVGRQGVLMFAVAAVPVVFWTRALDVFQLPKATLVVVAAAALFMIGAVRLAATGELVAPTGLPVYLAVAFFVAVLVSIVGSDQLAVSLLGVNGRWNGALLYTAYIFFFLVVLRSLSRPDVERLVVAFVCGTTAVVAYGVVQYAGADPIGWKAGLTDSVFASLGNPNFAAATLAIGAPLAARWLVSPATSPWARLSSGALALACVGVALATETVQGPTAAFAGLAVLAAAVLLEQRPMVRRLGLAVLGTLTAVSAVVVVLGVRGVGPLRSISDQTGIVLRGYYWEAAASMWAQNPFFGVGMGLYGVNHRQHRPLEAAVELPVENAADAAHSVPLSMFAEGGLVLGLTYLAFVVVIGVVAVRGLMRAEGEQRLLLGAVAGGWTAYQVQSLVSLDVPSLALWHWVLSGAVVVLAAPPTTVTHRLPWAPTPTRAAVRARMKGRQRTRPIEAVAPMFGAVVFVALLFPLTRPLRADTAAFRTGESDTVESALDSADRALTLAPWESDYWFLKGKLELQANRPDDAQVAFIEAVERDPTSVPSLMTAARVAESRGEIELARQFYERALDVEAQAPALLAEVGEFELTHGDAEDAIPLLERATSLRDDEGEWWQLLGSAHLEAGDRAEARTAFERALELDSEDEVARKGLASVRAD